MYLIDKKMGDEARRMAAEAPPFGPGFPADRAAAAESIEVWGSSFGDPGPDRTEFRLFDAAGNPVGQRVLGGY